MTKSFLFIFAVALFVTAGLASAATITQTQNFSGIPNISGPLAFNKFNAALGTLTSIQVGLSLQTSGGQIILDNDSTSLASGNFQFGAKGSISSSNVSLIDSSSMPIPGVAPNTANAFHSGAFSLAANVGDGVGDYSPSAPDGMSYSGGIETDTKSGYINNTVFGGYTGTGTYNIDYSVIQWLDYGSVSGIEAAFTPVSASGCVTVVYTYDPVPEPATITLLMIGALTLLKRKNSK
ncbi:MAG: choice-of-anchor E domain-containing protein [Phycisphaerae bacterium]|nr:choice-of-anchor E domain-containing protein [Phycisphaerae bacterium]